MVNDGLLVREPWKGVRVVQLDDDEIIEMFQFRLALQELAAELAAKHASSEQISEARRILAEMNDVLERGNIDAQMPLGGQLSQWICQCSGNKRLEQNWSRLTYQTRMYIYTSLRDAKDLRLIAMLWHELIDAIEQKDAAGARAAVRKLARRTLDDLNLPLGL